MPQGLNSGQHLRKVEVAVAAGWRCSLMSGMSDPYAPHQDFIRPAWGAPELWRVMVVVIVFDAIFALAPQILTAFLPTEAAVDAYYEGTTALATLAQFATFAISAVGFFILLQVLHGRGLWSVIGPPLAAWADFKRTALAVGLLLLAMLFLPPWIAFSELDEVRDFGIWVLLVPFAMLALLIQVGTEEIFFRGYLQQQLACLSSARWIWMGIPSLMFGSLHYWNGFGPADGLLYAFWATLLGLTCADLTARTGNLGAAIGLHLSNNAFALLIVGVQGWPASGLALFLYPYEDPSIYNMGAEVLLEPWAIVQLLIMALSVLVMWLAARIALRR